ncbi:MAG: F0F1 ATP synthase subunit A [Endomicrobiaceae bacterium]|nr:F0F1 ATP synthase subunit A [Endomicrobiaceae bacterium]
MILAPEILFKIAGFPVTNTIVTTVITDIVIISLVLILKFTISLYPKIFQNIMESVVEYFYDSTKDVAGSRVKFIYPWVLTFFIFIVVSNLMGLLPGFETIRFHPIGNSSHEGVPLFRTATSDLNLTAAFAVVSIFMTHFYAIKHTGVKSYIRRFVSFQLFPVFLFVGFLEFIGEFTKVISLAFRLFGNILAGEVVLGTMSSMVAFGVPVPFMMLEVMVALIQAVVFAMLTMAFMNIMTEKH